MKITIQRRWRDRVAVIQHFYRRNTSINECQNHLARRRCGMADTVTEATALNPAIEGDVSVDHASSGCWPSWAFQAHSVILISVNTAVKLESSGLHA